MTVNTSIVMIQRGNLKHIRLQIEAGEEFDEHHMRELLNEADQLAGAVDCALYDPKKDYQEMIANGGS